MNKTMHQANADIDRMNLDVINRMADAFSRKDLDSILELFAGDGIYEDYTGPAPTGNRYKGHAAIRQVFEQQMKDYPGHYFEDHLAVASNNRGALEYTVVVPGDPEQRAKFCDFFEFDNGKVKRKSTWMKILL